MPPQAPRAGFTLIEILVVISILLLVTAMTLSIVNLTITGDRARGAARQVQSMLEGGRTRAVYGGATKGAKYQAGVRFVPDANNPALITSLQFIEVDPENSSISRGVFEIQRDAGGNPTRLVGTHNTANVAEQSKTHWFDAYQNGLLYDNQTILLDDRKYQFTIPRIAGNPDPTRFSANAEEILLTTPYVGTTPSPLPSVVAVPRGSEPAYQILLAPQPMANQEPRLLGNGVVLDLNLSKNFNTLGQPTVDILFSPRGTVVGPLSGTGIVQFAVSDREDSLKAVPLAWTKWQAGVNYAAGATVISSNGDTTFVFRSAGGTSAAPEPTWVRTLNSTTADAGGFNWTCLGGPKRERMLISLTPQTGKAAVHPVYLDPLGATLDPYRYAETGEVARQ